MDNLMTRGALLFRTLSVRFIKIYGILGRRLIVNLNGSRITAIMFQTVDTLICVFIFLVTIVLM